MELRRKPHQRQLFAPARGPLRLRTDGAESRRILEQRAAAAGDRHQTLPAAHMVRLSVLHPDRRNHRMVRKQAVPAPSTAENGTGDHPQGAGAREGAYKHENQFLHQHFTRTADAPDADLRPGEHATRHTGQKTPARTDQSD